MPAGHNGLTSIDEHRGNDPQEGMSLRDYFAATALRECMRVLAAEGTLTRHGAAESAYGFADAMLAARAKGRG